MKAAVRRLNATNRVANPGDVGLGDGGRSACGGPSGDESGDGILERLHATGVGYSYTAFDAPVLSDVDCDIRKGDKIAIVGPTGSGKSTLLKLLAGLIEPVCGTVTINGGGCRIYDADSRWKAGRLAYVHQESTVFNETLRDNITLHRPWLTDDDIVRGVRGCRHQRGDDGSGRRLGRHGQ